ncbi:cyclase family protein [Paenibacillus sp. MAH-36]|uniref:Cyclase family protein n=1 Tax=Paenibacillus violae TaxID=3077234 RepID=A0ABU3RAW7_9BACL|nr:cyclase family protein [Paenibacillus sp. PFR10]MDU0201027.1 cyclase family protein [Paenibacillus sp. PFR10]
MKLIDLSVPISPQIREPLPAKIDYSTHEEGAVQAAAALGLAPENFPEKKAWATETVTLNTHSGTHVDAPWHYWPTSEGKPARTIDELPLEWFYSDGVLLDFSSKPPGYEITKDDFIAELKRINYTLKPFDIVLIRSDADKRLYHEHYAFLHAGVSAEATLWLLECGIKVVGTDGWGWDIPLNLQAEDYRNNPRDGVLWAAHYLGKDREYCQIEKLANLDQLPKPYGFKVSCFPMKIERASAGWARPVAIFE